MKILLISFLLVCTALAGPADPEPVTDQWWMDRHNQFVQNSANNPNTSIIFFGASWTEFWGSTGKSVFDQYYAPLGVANYGISGDRTEHVLWRIQNGEVDGLANVKLVVVGGDPCSNGFGSYNDDAEIANGIRAILFALRQRLPNTKILYLGVLPRTDVPAYFLRSADVNIMISKFEIDSNVHYLNFFDHFSSRFGSIDPLIYEPDLLHFNQYGYQRWADRMNKVFFELLE